MSTLTIPNTLVNGATNDAGDVNDNFDAVETWANGNVGPTNLSAPYGIMAFTFSTAALAGAASAYHRVKLPTGIAFQPVTAEVAYQTEAGASSATLSIQNVTLASALLSSSLVSSTAASVATTSSFAAASVAGATELLFTVLAGANNLTYVTVTLYMQAILQVSKV